MAGQLTLTVDNNDKIALVRLDATGEESVISIAADQLNIDATTTFSSGYDPATKETPQGAQDKVNSLQSDLDTIFDNAVQNGTTIISGGFIETSLLDVDDILAQNATVAGTFTIGVGGEFDSDILNFDKDSFTLSDGDLLINSVLKKIAISDAVDINNNTSLSFAENIESGTFVGTFEPLSPSESETFSITVGDGGSYFDQIKISFDSFSNPSLPTYPGTQDYDVAIDIKIEGQRVSDSVWETISFSRSLETTETYQDPLAGAEQDPDSLTLTLDLDRDISIKKSSKYSDYRMSIENFSADSYSFQSIRQRDVSKSSVINKGGALVNELQLQDKIKLYAGSSVDFIELVAEQDYDGTQGNQVVLRAKHFVNGVFEGVTDLSTHPS